MAQLDTSKFEIDQEENSPQLDLSKFELDTSKFDTNEAKPSLLKRGYETLMEPLLPEADTSGGESLLGRGINIGENTPLIKNIWPGGIHIPGVSEIYNELLRPMSAPIGIGMMGAEGLIGARGGLSRGLPETTKTAEGIESKIKPQLAREAPKRLELPPAKSTQLLGRLPETGNKKIFRYEGGEGGSDINGLNYTTDLDKVRYYKKPGSTLRTSELSDSYIDDYKTITQNPNATIFRVSPEDAKLSRAFKSGSAEESFYSNDNAYYGTGQPRELLHPNRLEPASEILGYNPKPRLEVIKAEEPPKTPESLNIPKPGQAKSFSDVSPFTANVSSADQTLASREITKPIADAIITAQDEKVKWIATTERELSELAKGLGKNDRETLGMLIDGQEMPNASPELILRANQARVILDQVHDMFPEGATKAGKDVGYLENYFTHIQHQPEDFRSSIKNITDHHFGIFQGEEIPLGKTLSRTPQITKDDFISLGQQQRGLPESAMEQAQHELGGGVMSSAIEHIGDIMHRMNDKNTFDTAGYEYVKEKVDKSLRWMKNPYGFEKEFNENLKNNASYRKIDLSQFESNIINALNKYSDAHSNLPTYNRAQELAKQAAVSLGKKDFKSTVSALEELKTHLNSVDEWSKFAREGLSDEGKNNNYGLGDFFDKGMGNPNSPYVEPRIGQQHSIIYDVNKVFPAYIESAAKVIFDKPAVEAATKHLKKIPDSNLKELASWYIKNYTRYDAEAGLHNAWNRWASTIARTTSRSLLGFNTGLQTLHLARVPANLWPELGSKYTGIGLRKIASAPIASWTEAAKLGLLQNEIRPFQFRTPMEKFDSVSNFLSVADYIDKTAGYFGYKQKFLDQGMPESQAQLAAIRETKRVSQTSDPARQMKLTSAKSNVAGGEVVSRLGWQFKQVPIKIVEQYVRIANQAKSDPKQAGRMVAGVGLALAANEGLRTFHLDPMHMIGGGMFGAFGDTVYKVANRLAKGDWQGALEETALWATPAGKSIQRQIKQGLSAIQPE